jgi:TctA family transporter
VVSRTRQLALAPSAVLTETYGPVLIFLLLGVYPWVLLLTWVVALYLTFIETRQQHLDRVHTLWWMLLVFLTHFLGYLALRGWVFYQRRAAV